MKIKQDKVQFKPITLVIENLKEAQEFLDLVDKGCINSDVARRLSDAVTNGIIEIPNNISDGGFHDI